MKTTKTSLRLAAIALFLGVASAAAVACSGDDNNSNPAPTTDSGMGTDSTMSGDDSSMSSDSTSPTDSTAPIDSPSLDTGSCKSDGGTCNSCYSAVQASADPYNACTAFTATCIPFDSTRVPSHPQL